MVVVMVVVVVVVMVVGDAWTATPCTQANVSAFRTLPEYKNARIFFSQENFSLTQ